MPIAHLLQDFSTATASNVPLNAMSDDELEEMRLASFERGYAAGWDDAVAAQERDKARVSAALAQNLEDLSFTYHEAFNQLVLSLEPVLRTLIDASLPEVMRATVGPRLLDEARNLANDHAAGPVRIAVPAGTAEALKPLLPEDPSMPVEIIEDASLEPDQAVVRIGAHERELDSNRLTRSFTEAIDAFFHQTHEELTHG